MPCNECLSVVELNSLNCKVHSNFAMKPLQFARQILVWFSLNFTNDGSISYIKKLAHKLCISIFATIFLGTVLLNAITFINHSRANIEEFFIVFYQFTLTLNTIFGFITIVFFGNELSQIFESLEDIYNKCKIFKWFLSFKISLKLYSCFFSYRNIGRSQWTFTKNQRQMWTTIPPFLENHNKMGVVIFNCNACSFNFKMPNQIWICWCCISIPSLYVQVSLCWWYRKIEPAKSSSAFLSQFTVESANDIGICGWNLCWNCEYQSILDL